MSAVATVLAVCVGGALGLGGLLWVAAEIGRRVAARHLGDGRMAI